MDLNTILLILGVVALIGLVAHGVWANRREKSQYFANENSFKAEQQQPAPQSVPNFTQPASVAQNPLLNQSEANENTGEYADIPVQSAQNVAVSSPYSANSLDQIKIIVPNEPTQKAAAPLYDYPAEQKASNTVSTAEQSAYYHYDPAPRSVELSIPQQEEAVKEPVISVSPISTAKPQQPLEQQSESQQTTKTEAEASNAPESAVINTAKSYILLYVVAPQNRRFQGSSLMQTFENLGFIFGKGDLYHRHLDHISSPIIFSIANIEEPGTFNPYGIFDFSTIGVSLFMPVPSAVGNEKANLKMMIKAAQYLATELNGFVLTDQQEIFDEKAEQAYLALV